MRRSPHPAAPRRAHRLCAAITASAMRNPFSMTRWPTLGVARRGLAALLILATAPAAGAVQLPVGTDAGGAAPPGPTQAPQEAPTVASPSFFAVSVADLAASEAWYRRTLGLETVRSVESRDGRGRALVMRRGELVVELVHFEGSRAPRADPAVEHPFQIEGLVKAGVFVADAGQWHTYLLEAGVEADAEVVIDGALGVRTFVFRDPDGNRVQVFERCKNGCQDPARQGPPAAGGPA